MQFAIPRRALIFSCISLFAAAAAVAALFFFNFREFTALVLYPLLLILLFVFGRYFSRGVVRYVAIYLIVIVVALFLFELYSIATRGVDNNGFAGSYAHSYFKFDPNLGHVAYGPGRYNSIRYDKMSGHTIYDVTYSISNLGFRETAGAQDGRSVIFFGDSFTFGEGLNDADTLPQAFSDLTGRTYHVLNFGFHGYGPQQSLRILELGLFDQEFGQRPTLFVLQTAAWHAERTACIPDYTYFGPRYELGDRDEVRYRGVCRSRFTYYFGRLMNLSYGLTRIWDAINSNLRPLYDADFNLYLEILKRLDRIVKDKYHSRLLIAYLRFEHDSLFKGSSYSDKRLMDSLVQHGVAVIDATLRPKGTFLHSNDGNDELIIKDDGHPNALAQQKRAKLIYEWFQQHMGMSRSMLK